MQNKTINTRGADCSEPPAIDALLTVRQLAESALTAVLDDDRVGELPEAL
jgi:hypothetical protein